jgi:hypothetical protein
MQRIFEWHPRAINVNDAPPTAGGVVLMFRALGRLWCL